MTTQWRIEFKVIDHDSDECAPTEATIVEAATRLDALNEFYDDMSGYSIEVLSIEEILN